MSISVLNDAYFAAYFKIKVSFPPACPINWYGPSQLTIKAFFFPGCFILTIVSPATRPSKI
jgi:hypothetical protein